MWKGCLWYIGWLIEANIDTEVWKGCLWFIGWLIEACIDTQRYGRGVYGLKAN